MEHPERQTEVGPILLVLRVVTWDVLSSYCGEFFPPNDNLGDKLLKLVLHIQQFFVRILKISRTIADVEGVEEVQPAHVAEAVQYRSAARRFTA